MGKIAVYTFMQEGGQMPAQPYNASVWKAKGFDFICFVTKKGDMPDYCGAWYIDELPISWEDRLLNAVIPKINPQSVLEDYEYSLWLDGDVAITGDAIYEHCLEMQQRGVVYADLEHTSIRSVYSYAWKVWRQGLEPFKVVWNAVSFLISKGILPGAGFHDTSVMFRAHENEAVLEFDRWWWECLLLRAGSHYDQLMHIFALIDTPSLKWEHMSSEGLSL